MRGRSENLSGNNETDEALRKSTRSNTVVSNKTDLPTPKKLEPIKGKQAPKRLDKPLRGKIDADAYKGGGKIKPSHKGLLHKDLDVPMGEKIPMRKIKAAEHSKSAKIRKRAQFADNFHH